MEEKVAGTTLLKGSSYRSPRGQPYTRQKYIHGSPAKKISRFTMGDTKRSYPLKVSLLSENHIQVRHNALESARVAANKVLSDKLGEAGYLLRLCVYPHNILRENRMIATAGADRLQHGMTKSYGRPSSRAARVKRNQAIITVQIDDANLQLAKNALRAGAAKFPSTCRIVVETESAAKLSTVDKTDTPTIS